MAGFVPAGASGSSTNVVVSGAIQPTVSLVDMPAANTEYDFVLPTNTKRFMLKLRGSAGLRVAYVAGESAVGGDYLTVPSGCSYTESDLTLTSITIYFQSGTASQTAEVVYWI